MVLPLLCTLGCAELPAEAESSHAGPTVTAEHVPTADGGAAEIEVDEEGPRATEDHGDCRGESSEPVALLGWREVQSPDGDVVVEGRSLTLVLETQVDHALDARLSLTVRADGEERVVSLGALHAEPGRPAERSLPLAVDGLDLASLEHPAQLIVEATFYGEQGEPHGSAHTPAIFALLDASGAPIAATEEALRARFSAGASILQRRRGLDPLVAGYGRGRMARPEDLHGDPEDVLTLEGGE